MKKLKFVKMRARIKATVEKGICDSRYGWRVALESHHWFYLVAFFGYVAIPLIVFGMSLTSVKVTVWDYYTDSYLEPLYDKYPYYMFGVALTMSGVMSAVAAAACAGLGVKEWLKEKRCREGKTSEPPTTLRCLPI